MQINYSLIANRAAKKHGSNRATSIRRISAEEIQTKVVRFFRNNPEKQKCSMRATVEKYDPYHAESRTGIRASMAALKRFWSTYHYVATVCVVAVPDAQDIYNSDNH